MFAGQGAQFYAMGRELYENHPVFRDWLTYCSKRLEPSLNASIVEMLYQPRASRLDPFDRTRFTHPSIFSVNFALAQTLVSEGVHPTHFLGYSLGEAVAWTMAGVVRLEEALSFVLETAVAIEERTPPGGMLAILTQMHPELMQGTTLASLNYVENFVVSGHRNRIAELHENLKSRGIVSQPLPVTHGFHSPLIDPVEAEVKDRFRLMKLRPFEKPVISAHLARELTGSDMTADYCWNVLREPIRFHETIEKMERDCPAVYIDAGPSGTLAAFVRQIIGRDQASRVRAVLTPFGKDLRGLEKAKADY